MAEGEIRAALRAQAGWCRALAAPFTAMVCDAVAERFDEATAFGRRLVRWPGDPFVDALPMRVTGGLNALVRSGALPDLAALYPPSGAPDPAMLADAVAAALAHRALAAWLDTPPQTNEVMRSAALYPGLLAIALATGRPLSLRELGASAGLNLRLDGYRYTLGGRDFGPAVAPVMLIPEWDGPPPPGVALRIADRRGVDIAPLDVRDPAVHARLLAYVWPDQPARVARLEAALAAAALDPPSLDRADAADWAEAMIAPVPGLVTVAFHSVAFQYFPPATQTRLAAHLTAMGDRATAEAPFAWLRMEPDDPAAAKSMSLRLRLWPDGDDRLLARVHPHGARVAWLDA